jgi:hypothetical protein
MGETALKIVEPEETGKKALTYSETIKGLQPIKTNDEYIFIGQLWKTGKALLEEINEGYDSLIKKAHELHKDALAKKAKYYIPTEIAVRDAKKLLSAYDAEQERIRKAEETRLAEIARKAEEDRILAEAIEAEKSGDKETAEAIIKEEVYVPPIVVPKTTPKMNGGPVYQERWFFEIVDASLIPRTYLIPDEVKIGGVVRSLKGQTNIPGIKAFSKRV